MGKQMYSMSMANNVSTHPASHPLVVLPVQDAVVKATVVLASNNAWVKPRGVVFNSSWFY